MSSGGLTSSSNMAAASFEGLPACLGRSLQKNQGKRKMLTAEERGALATAPPTEPTPSILLELRKVKQEKKNPLKNLNVPLKLNPYAKTARGESGSSPMVTGTLPSSPIVLPDSPVKAASRPSPSSSQPSQTIVLTSSGEKEGRSELPEAPELVRRSTGKELAPLGEDSRRSPDLGGERGYFPFF